MRGLAFPYLRSPSLTQGILVSPYRRRYKSYTSTYFLTLHSKHQYYPSYTTMQSTNTFVPDFAPAAKFNTTHFERIFSWYQVGTLCYE